MDVQQGLQLAGAVLILAAFIAGQAGRLDVRSYPYLVLNLTGSSILAVLAWLGSDWGFLLLEAVWAVVSAGSLVQRIRSPGAAPEPGQ